MAPPKGDVTGFDPKKFVQAGAHSENDPWKRREAWRSTGPFTRFNRFKRALPGLGTGATLFGLYLVYEQMFMKDEHAHHGEEHH